MTDYIITEEQLGRISSVIVEDATHDYKIGFFEEIRSRPLSVELQKEREFVLKEIYDIVCEGVALLWTPYKIAETLLKKIKELRGKNDRFS